MHLVHPLHSDSVVHGDVAHMVRGCQRELEDGSTLVYYIEDSVVESQRLLIINGPPEGYV